MRPSMDPTFALTQSEREFATRNGSMAWRSGSSAGWLERKPLSKGETDAASPCPPSPVPLDWFDDFPPDLTRPDRIDSSWLQAEAEDSGPDPALDGGVPVAFPERDHHVGSTSPRAARRVPEVPEALRDHPRYEILAPLGFGGMGDVFLARHRLLGRRVALKVLRTDLVHTPALMDRFHREMRAASRLSHPHVVAVYDAEEWNGVRLMVMEYVEGRTLGQEVQRRGPLPIAEVMEVARQAAEGLRHAHELGMVHRDIKPHNLMRTPEGIVKLLDFGLARLVSEHPCLSDATETGVVLGSVDYMAPEQALNPREADIRADLYALGCTLYHLLVGHPPFPEGSAYRKLKAHESQTAPAPAALRPEVPIGLSELVVWLMAKNPADRPSDPAALLSLLDRVRANPDASPRRAASPTLPHRLNRWCRTIQHHRGGVVAAAAVLLAGLIGWSAALDSKSSMSSHVLVSASTSSPTISAQSDFPPNAANSGIPDDHPPASLAERGAHSDTPSLLNDAASRLSPPRTVQTRPVTNDVGQMVTLDFVAPADSAENGLQREVGPSQTHPASVAVSAPAPSKAFAIDLTPELMASALDWLRYLGLEVGDLPERLAAMPRDRRVLMLILPFDRQRPGLPHADSASKDSSSSSPDSPNPVRSWPPNAPEVSHLPCHREGNNHWRVALLPDRAEIPAPIAQNRS